MNTNTAHKQPTQSPAEALPDDHPNSAANIQRRQTLKIAERDEFGRLLKGSVLPNAGHPPGALITTLARAHTSHAIAVLVEIMNDPKAPQAARATCAQALLDRGYGKAPVQIDLTARAKFDDFLRDVGRTAEARRAEAIAVAANTLDLDENNSASEV